jgi:hypothetical protein
MDPGNGVVSFSCMANVETMPGTVSGVCCCCCCSCFPRVETTPGGGGCGVGTVIDPGNDASCGAAGERIETRPGAGEEAGAGQFIETTPGGGGIGVGSVMGCPGCPGCPSSAETMPGR